MKVLQSPSGSLIKAWIDGIPVEQSAIDQLAATASMPFIHRWIAAMPDVHTGIGSTVGSVVPTKRAIIPACVGVDLGCGIMAMRTTLTASQLPDNLASLRSSIEAAVPHGRTDNGGANDKGAWLSDKMPICVELGWNHLFLDFAQIVAKHPAIEKANSDRHLGTLGTGNHFIELCLDEAQRVWVMLHSGSRGVGGKIGSYFIDLAKQEMERWFIHLPNKDLAYLPEGSQYFNDYLQALRWAQRFALVNRELMMLTVLDVLKTSGLPDFECDQQAINCHHNYVAKENHFGENVWVTRKGAVRAREGDLGIIPGSMGAKSFIVRGNGNRDSFCSCSHGAGRNMSRKEAQRRFTVADHIVATAGVECRKDEEVIDETPMAYKNIDDVMAAQSELVEVVHTLKQVLCVKG